MYIYISVFFSFVLYIKKKGLLGRRGIISSAYNLNKTCGDTAKYVCLVGGSFVSNISFQDLKHLCSCEFFRNVQQKKTNSPD